MKNLNHETQSPESYQLTRGGFLDAVVNRIHVVHFYSTSLHRARVFPLPRELDYLGRVKVALAINPDFPRERQAQSLVHEMVHIDRNSWERVVGLDKYSAEQVRNEEEDLAERTASAFFNANKPLAIKAYNHVWLRREDLNI